MWGTGERGHVGVQLPTAPSELFCPVFWCGVQSKWKLFMYRAVWSCLITRPYDCCNSRCPGLQRLEIPCVRNIGLGLESWNFIWEHLSICQKRCREPTSKSEFLWVWMNLQGFDAAGKHSVQKDLKHHWGRAEEWPWTWKLIEPLAVDLHFFQGLNCSVITIVRHSALKCGQSYKTQLFPSPNYWWCSRTNRK